VIVLDTNVLSEALRSAPSAAVVEWLLLQMPSAMFITIITQAEILYGVEKLPAEKRRAGLLAGAEEIFAERFDSRLLPFDEPAARLYAEIKAAREAAGRPISDFDAMIAAIARSHGAAVATRNTKDFEGCGIKTINPWSV
jgi:predicted nucleic acid-binding protein